MHVVSFKFLLSHKYKTTRQTASCLSTPLSASWGYCFTRAEKQTWPSWTRIGSTGFKCAALYD